MDKKIIIGLVGETGSGKDTVALHLKKRYDADLFRFSYPLKKALGIFFDKPSKDDQAWMYGILKERFGEDILHCGLQRRMDRSQEQMICVNGVRLLTDEKFMRQFDHSVIIYVTADQKLRWQRAYDRGEKSDDQQSFATFQEFEATTPTEKSVPEIGARADYTITNNGTLDDLIAATDRVIDKVVG